MIGLLKIFGGAALENALPLLALAAAVGLLGWGAYDAGYGRAEAEGLVALTALKVEYAEERRAAADAYGKAVGEALQKYRDEVSRAGKIETTLAQERTEHEEETAGLRKRIARATKNSAHTFAPEFVLLCNAAFGAAVPANTLPAAGGAGVSFAGAGGGGGALDPRLLSGVTEADLLAWLVKRGGVYKNMKSRLRGWNALAKGWPQ